MTLWTRGHMRSQHNLKLLNCPYHNACGHQTCQGGFIPLGTPTHKLMIFWSHGLERSRDKLNTFYSICRRPMSTKQGKAMACHERLQPWKSHDLTLVTWQTDEIISQFSQNLAGFRMLTPKLTPISCSF